MNRGFYSAVLVILAVVLLRAIDIDRAKENRCVAPVVIQQFLTPEEARAVIQAALDQGLERSEVGTGQISKIRTSYQTFLKHDVPAVDAVIRKAEKYLGVSRDHFEELQVARYKPSQKYEGHFDSDEETPFEEMRSDTLLIYLSDVAEGGATAFPELGMAIAPAVGKAVHWKNVDSRGRILPCAFHAARPVRKGTKWICTVWCHLH